MKLVLASGSPRRKQLLEWVGLHAEVRTSGIDETRHPREAPIAYARRLALHKARAVAQGEGETILAADTVVHLDDRIFGKPADRRQARDHLLTLSGRTHQVTTAVAVLPHREPPRLGHLSTMVRFRELTPQEIEAYLATGDAQDKAGAYGIQGRAGAFVAELHGCWTNVMGLPLELCLALLELPPRDR
ncbi:MAG: septum formation protein Maf [Deltaproteobacteria bacterium]|nr:MAG: septum formation protein Maf [Deltaproteobacteria bacterium]